MRIIQEGSFWLFNQEHICPNCNTIFSIERGDEYGLIYNPINMSYEFEAACPFCNIRMTLQENKNGCL